MTRTITVNGSVTVVNTRTSLTAQGSVTTATRNVPIGWTKIDKIIVAVASAATSAGAATHLIRLSGAAVRTGEQTFVVATQCQTAATSAGDQTSPRQNAFIFENVNIDVSAGDIINVDAEIAGTLLGNTRIAVTLVFA